MSLPIVGIPTSYEAGEDRPRHYAGDKYVRAVSDGAGCVPMLLPALGPWYDWPDVLDRLDGVLLTGGLSNIEPRRYGLENVPEHEPYDPARDDTVLPLIRATLAAGVPLLGVCRGLQELNVALGGSLHPALHEVPGRMDHRADTSKPASQRYGKCHTVTLIEGGALHRLLGAQRIEVNSLHRQGIDRPSSRLAIEAVADDGQVEAVHVIDASAFALAVQWHPEWHWEHDRHAALLFQAFGDAARARAAHRRGSAAA